jgi:DNA repair exonuclease SbcCD ATPase subunit
MYEDLRKAVGYDQMSFSFDELLNWAQPLVMVVDHRNTTPETMEVLQNEWNAQGLVKIAPLHRSFEINRLKRKLEMLTEASDDTAEQEKVLVMEITRLESETLEERNQRKEEDDRKKEEAATVAKAERDRKRAEKEAEEEAQRVSKKEEARQRKEEEEAAKTAERDRKQAEKEEAKRVAKEAKRCVVCNHEGCDKPIYSKGVCREHGEKCNHEGCDKPIYSKGVCR